MREILFRGRRIDNNEWVYGDVIQDGSNYFIFPKTSGWFELKESLKKIIPETIGQYTGLTDKNGVKIFEGDVCYCNNEHYEIKLEEIGGAYKVVNFNDKSDNHFLLHTNDILQVVYNIHDK